MAVQSPVFAARSRESQQLVQHAMDDASSSSSDESEHIEESSGDFFLYAVSY